jgi:hypothetical protein
VQAAAATSIASAPPMATARRCANRNCSVICAVPSTREVRGDHGSHDSSADNCSSPGSRPTVMAPRVATLVATRPAEPLLALPPERRKPRRSRAPASAPERIRRIAVGSSGAAGLSGGNSRCSRRAGTSPRQVRRLLVVQSGYQAASSPRVKRLRATTGCIHF